jgi:hypothetical protein
MPVQEAMTKRLTPEQRFKQLFNLSHDESTTPEERESAQRKWQEWLKRHGKKPIDISSILAQAELDDKAANPPPPPPPPTSPPLHAFDDPRFNPASLIEDLSFRYLAMRPHVRIIYVLWIIATHVYTLFSIAPRILLSSEDPYSRKTTALEFARRLIFRVNEGAFSTEAAIRDHLSQGPGSIALDELDLGEPEARRALLRLWNLGHTNAKHTMMVAGRSRSIDLYAPMIAAGLGRILGEAQLSRALVLGMSPHSAGEAPEFGWWSPAKDGPDSIKTREAEFATFRAYLQHCAANWELNLQPPTPPGIELRSADNVRSLLAVADVCGKDWPARAREAIVILAREMNAEKPKIAILRHGLVLFDQLEDDKLEIGRFNKELRRLSEPGFDWNRFRGASGLDMNPRPISISEQGYLLGKNGIQSHSMWPVKMSRAQRKSGEHPCQRVYRRADFEAALRKAESSPSSSSPPALRLVSGPDE